MKFLRQTTLHFFARHEEKESIPHETEPKAEKAYLGKRLNRVVNALAASINDGELRFGARRGRLRRLRAIWSDTARSYWGCRTAIVQR